ncbi:RNA pseudouridine synthase [Alginatibacterium sediminis]|uniref:Dual-specificity RNA pseudouridine synthase RluA n=1 Tax=Alginatibacterium sediminis TaxID=2164068 RepID=A0A420E7I8_9ALTE|nr:pseudouridine synthase [Alginatibacterium sediminis]RKF14547.1 RNA pseudouridine synthase [Alginatibacterium sediminis]
MRPAFIYAPPQTPWLRVVYQDDTIVVFDKPAGLLTVPGRAAEHQDSLWLRAVERWPSIKVIHRLDMATSGLVLMALGSTSQSHLSRQFAARSVDKHYVAQCYGQCPDSEGLISLAMRCDWNNRPRQVIDLYAGKPAQTKWTLLQQKETSFTVRLQPITGRSHQLRLHMLSLGTPIVGDEFYAHPRAKHFAKRMHLHAAGLTILHPGNHESISFESSASFV